MRTVEDVRRVPDGIGSQRPRGSATRARRRPRDLAAGRPLPPGTVEGVPHTRSR